MAALRHDDGRLALESKLACAATARRFPRTVEPSESSLHAATLMSREPGCVGVGIALVALVVALGSSAAPRRSTAPALVGELARRVDRPRARPRRLTLLQPIAGIGDIDGDLHDLVVRLRWWAA